MKRALLFFAAGIFALILIGAGVVYVLGQRTPTKDPVIKQSTSAEGAAPNESLVFPELVGTSLLLEQVSVPSDLAGDYKLVVVSYDASQQLDVDEWLPALEDLNEEFPQLAGYYIPLLPKSAADSSVFIIGGMAAVAKSDVDRGRTIVVFTNVDSFNRLVNVPNKDVIQLFLIDQNQHILWQGSGLYNEKMLDELRAILQDTL
ncbi:MAG: hypothetical protein HY862_09635 [Chloroflexi bacterium]|nr:hypothetical protein [Chloroflexota bacterium]